jgi:hypothetical protein
MRVFAISLFVILISCTHGIQNNSVLINDSLIIDSIYGKDTWVNSFQPVKTSFGNIIKYKVINDSSYQIQWGDSIDLKIYPETFHLDGHAGWVPHYIADNKDYIVLRQSCGNPCWIGYFLPISDTIKPHAISEYLDFDLDNNLVASIKYPNLIEIINLRTNCTEKYIINGCNSAFIGYCIDSLSIKNKVLKYNWIPKTIMDSNNYITRIEKIKI